MKAQQHDTGRDEPQSGFRYGMRAFRHRDFTIFFIGAVTSNSGSWLQNLAVPYVLYQVTGKGLWVGLAGFAQFIPSFLVGPLGGSLADRMDRRRVLLGSQALMAVAALMLWAAWVLHWHNPWLVLSFTALMGLFNGLSSPSWQAFVPSLVPRSDLGSAITLNSTQFNASRALGPAVAGVLLATGGPAWAFFLNGVSFLAVLAALAVVNPVVRQDLPTSQARARSGAGGAEARAGGERGTSFRDALSYMWGRSGLVIGVLCSMMVAFFGNPLNQLTVVFAKEVYHAGPKVVGALAASMGVGAVLAAPLMSSWDALIPKSTMVRWSMPAYGASVLAFALAPNWPLGILALLFVGASFLAVVASTNTAMQVIVADRMRGRVLSARIMGFTLAYPLGSLVQGWLVDIWGPQTTVAVAGGVLVAISMGWVLRPSLLAGLDRTDDTPDWSRWRRSRRSAASPPAAEPATGS